MNSYLTVIKFILFFSLGICAKNVTERCNVKTFSLRQKRQAVNPCSRFINPCFQRGICIPTGTTTFRCECHSNLYKGEKCEEEVKHCESSPCENGGTCEEGQGTYICVCTPSYQGINCEIGKTGVTRISKPFLFYEVDILVTYIQKYVIACGSLGSNLKIDVSTGDGFSLTIQGKHFTKVISVKEWLKSKNIHGRLKPDQENELRYVFHFNHIYTKNTYTKIKLDISNDKLPVIEMELPLVVHSFFGKCVPSVSLHSCGQDVKYSTKYNLDQRISITSRVHRSCIGSKLIYKWNLYIPNPELPVLPGIRKTVSSDLPGKMIFDPFTLQEGLHMVQLTVKEEAINTHYNLARCWFRIVSNPPVAVIDGGSVLTRGWDQDFVIDASSSYDPDISPGIHPNSHLKFIWSCWNVLSESVSETFCKGKTKDLPQKENKLYVERRSLQPDNVYGFQLVLKKNNLNTSTVQKIRTVVNNPPQLKLVCMKNCGPEVLPNEAVVYKMFQYSSEHQNFNLNYSWDMSPGIDNQKKMIDWPNETKGGKNADSLIIFPNTLLHGDEYIFKLLATTENNVASELELTMKTVLKLHDGECKVNPIKGTSLLTAFKIYCSGFGDLSGDQTVLKYYFYQEYKSHNIEYSLLLHYDTHPIAENLNLVPGLAADNYQTKIFVKVTDWHGGFTFFNMTAEVKPLHKTWDLKKVLEKCYDITRNPELVYSVHDVSGSLQNISAFTNILPTLQEIKNETKKLGMKMREIFIQSLCKVNVFDISIAQQLSLVLLNILSPWEGEKVSAGSNGGATYDSFSPVTVKFGGLLMKRLSDQLYLRSSIIRGLKVAEISRTNSLHMADTLLSIGELIMRNQSDILYGIIDDWEEYRNVDVIFEDYPDYKELDYEYHLNLKNYSQGVAWFLEGMEQLSRALGKILLKEEDAIELKTKDISYWIKIDLPLNVADKRLGISDEASGIFISKQFAAQLQYYTTDIIGVQVGILSYNPIWWGKNPAINSDAIHANIWNAVTGENIPILQKSSDLKISLKMKSINKGVGNDNSSLIHASLDISEIMSEENFIVHQINLPCGGALMIQFEDSNDINKKYLVAITKHHRPSLKSFSEDVSIQLPHSNKGENKEFVIPITDRPHSFKVIGSCQHNDLFKQQLLYLAVLPKDIQIYYGKSFSYSFRAEMVLCEHWEFTSGWSSRECQAGPESSEDYIQCICSHLSLFGVSLLAAPNRVNPFSDIKLFLRIFQNPVSVTLVSAILIMYLFLLIWSRKKDLNDRKKNILLFLEQNYPTDNYVYILTVNTGAGDDCGTTANVALRLEGTNGLSRVYLVSSLQHKTLTSNSQDWFVLTTPEPLGELLNIRLWHDSTGQKPSWFCESVVVREFEKTDVVGVWVFLVNRWLSVGGLSNQPRIYYSATLPCCKVRTATQTELMKWRLVFNNSARLNFSDKHEWLGIFKRPAHSPYTSCQRLSMAVCVLLSTMLANVMLYGIPEPEPSGQLDEGFFYFTIREWIISIEGAFIVFILSAPPFLFFRNSEPGDLELGKSLLSMIARVRQTVRKKKEQVFEKDLGVPDTSLFKSMQVMDEHFINAEFISKLKKHSYWLPIYFRLIAWIWCVAAIIISSYLTCLYGLSFGKFKALLWISSFMLAFLQGIFIFQPLKVIVWAALDSFIMMITDGKIYNASIKHPPPEMTDMTCLSTQSRDKTKTLISSISKLSFFGGKNIKRHRTKSQKITEHLARKERKWREWSSSSIDILCLLFYITALYVVAYYTSDRTSWNSSHVFRELLSQSLHNQGKQGPKLNSLTSTTDLLDFLNLTVIPTLNARVGYNGEPIKQDDGWTANFPYKLLGAPRLRQIRVKSELCSIPMEMNHIVRDKKCIPTYNYYTEDKDDYGIGWEKQDILTNTEGREQKPWIYHTSEETNATVMIGQLNLYPGHGFWTELGRNLKNSRRTFEYLWKSGWFDRNTRAVMIEFSTYSTDCNMFSVVSILIERGPTGIFLPKFQIQTSRLIVQESTEYAINITSYVIFITATVLLSYRHCRRYFLSYKTKRIAQKDQPPQPEPKTTPGDTKFKRLICVIFLSADQLELKPGTSKWKVLLNFILHPKSDLPTVKPIAVTGKKGLLSPESSEIPENLISTPKYPLQPLKYPKVFEIIIVLLTFIILGIHIQQYLAIHKPLENLEHGSNEHRKFFSLFDGLLWDSVFRYILAVDVTVATMALWRALPNFRRLPTKTLTYSAKDPFPNLVIMCLILMIGFSSAAFCNSILRGTYEFSSFSNSFFTLLRWSQHSPLKEDFSESLAVRMIFCIFSLVSTIYLINLFLAVLISYVEGTHKKMKLQKYFALRDIEYSVGDLFYEWTQSKISVLKTKAKNRQELNEAATRENGTNSETHGLPGGGPTASRKSAESSTAELPKLQKDKYSIDVKKTHFYAMRKLIKSWIKDEDGAEFQIKGNNYKQDKKQSKPRQKEKIVNEKMLAMTAFTVSCSKDQKLNNSPPKKYLSLIRYFDDKCKLRVIEKEKLEEIRKRVLQMYYRNQFKENPEYKIEWEGIVGRQHEKRLKIIEEWKSGELQNITPTSMTERSRYNTNTSKLWESKDKYLVFEASSSNILKKTADKEERETSETDNMKESKKMSYEEKNINISLTEKQMSGNQLKLNYLKKITNILEMENMEGELNKPECNKIWIQCDWEQIKHTLYSSKERKKNRHLEFKEYMKKNEDVQLLSDRKLIGNAPIKESHEWSDMSKDNKLNAGGMRYVTDEDTLDKMTYGDEALNKNSIENNALTVNKEEWQKRREVRKQRISSNIKCMTEDTTRSIIKKLRKKLLKTN